MPLLRILSITALVGLQVSTAAALTLPFVATVDVVFDPVPVFVTIEGTGLATVNDAPGGALTRLQLPADVFQTAGLSFPGTGIVSQIEVDAANGPGSFVLTAGGGGGAMPILGQITVCLLAACDAGGVVLTLPMDPIGMGGTAMVTGPITLTLFGAPWTKGTTTISAPGIVSVLQGFAHGPLLNTGTTVALGGVLELVTPLRVTTSINLLDELIGSAVLRVQFVPEPGTAPLLGGALALLAAGVRRRRLRSRASARVSPAG